MHGTQKKLEKRKKKTSDLDIPLTLDDSDESPAIRLILERMCIYRLRSTTPLGLNVFD